MAARMGLFVLLVVVVVQGSPWDPVDDVLTKAVANHSFPGCVAMVAKVEGTSAHVVYEKAFGSYTYGLPAPANGDNPPMTTDTVFDLASLTKVLATTTAVAQFYERGELALDQRLCDDALLGSRFCRKHPAKQQISVYDCMTHTAGYPPDPSPTYDLPAFACPETLKNPVHPKEVFTCQEKIHAGFLDQHLLNPVGTVYLYSDLSMMSMMWVVGKLARVLGHVQPHELDPQCEHAHALEGEASSPVDQCYYESYVRKFVAAPLQGARPASHFLFRPKQEQWKDCAPAENDTWYRHRVIQGQVHDENAYASGGVQGHAGFFASATNATAFGGHLLSGSGPYPYNATTVSLFTHIADAKISSRALGWDTNHKSPPGSSSCGTLSPETFFHTGFTGTLICNDPIRNLVVVLFTNRVYPTRNNTAIGAARRQFTTAVQSVMDSVAVPTVRSFPL